MFEFSLHIDKNKIFLIDLSEVEKRLDPLYYIPYISNLEKEVRKHKSKPLKYYGDLDNLLTARDMFSKCCTLYVPNRSPFLTTWLNKSTFYQFNN
jgi:hypothetical protein